MEQMQERTIEHLTKQLNLTPDQVTQVRAIYKDGNTQMMSIRGDSSIPREDKREKLKALHESSRAKVREVLTEEQKPKFDEMIAHQQDRMERRDGDHGAPPPPPPPPQ